MNTLLPSPPKKLPPTTRPLVSLALQGGGSHGAFTWGVLDALLDDGRMEIEGISGTSAGAMNAVALAHGFAQAQGQPGRDRREAARESLANFWSGIVNLGALSEAQRAPFAMLFGQDGARHAAAQWASAMATFWTSTLSPYQSNPFNLNPLRQFVEKHIDFERIAQLRDTKVFVIATCVSTGKAEVFTGTRLTADAVMASACLPTLFKAVEIEGRSYWDGGFSGNPSIHPLIYNCRSRDVVLVQINPIARDTLPTTSLQIMDRMNEITFNAGLIAEMRAIDFVNRLLAAGKLDPAHYKSLLLHRIDGGEALESFAASTKSSTKASLIYALRDLGQTCTRDWLATRFASLGVASTVDIKRDYLDDLRMPVKPRRSG